MNRKTLYKASVFMAVIGLTLMYASSLYLSIERVDIGEIEKSWSGKNVRIAGSVVDFSRSGETAFIELKDRTGQILVVDFDSSIELEEDEDINVTGHVSIYEGELEVIARDIQR